MNQYPIYQQLQGFIAAEQLLTRLRQDSHSVTYAWDKLSHALAYVQTQQRALGNKYFEDNGLAF